MWSIKCDFFAKELRWSLVWVDLRIWEGSQGCSRCRGGKEHSEQWQRDAKAIKQEHLRDLSQERSQSKNSLYTSPKETKRTSHSLKIPFPSVSIRNPSLLSHCSSPGFLPLHGFEHFLTYSIFLIFSTFQTFPVCIWNLWQITSKIPCIFTSGKFSHQKWKLFDCLPSRDLFFHPTSVAWKHGLVQVFSIRNKCSTSQISIPSILLQASASIVPIHCLTPWFQTWFEPIRISNPSSLLLFFLPSATMIALTLNYDHNPQWILSTVQQPHYIFLISSLSYSPGGLFYFSFSFLKSSVPSTPYLMMLFLISFLLRISEASEENIPGFPTPLPVYLCLFSALKFSLLGPSPSCILDYFFSYSKTFTL